MQTTILLTDRPLDVPQLALQLKTQGCGAEVAFAGIVRPAEGELALRAIDYQAYRSMAERMLNALAREAEARWAPLRAVIAHRLGVVPVGEPSVWIGVASEHREEAFAAARFLIDELKARVPIWKRSHLPADDSGAQAAQT